MRLNLVVGDRRPELREIWSDVFQGIAEVSILDAGARTLGTMNDLDAELMMGMFAHERYGGRPRVGESQILSTRGEPGMPPWVVTTPPFPAHVGERMGDDNSVQTIVVPDRKLTSEEEDYIAFGEVFERIKEFNGTYPERRIGSLGFELAFINSPRADPRREAEAVRQAYVEHAPDVGASDR